MDKEENRWQFGWPTVRGSGIDMSGNRRHSELFIGISFDGCVSPGRISRAFRWRGFRLYERGQRGFYVGNLTI